MVYSVGVDGVFKCRLDRKNLRSPGTKRREEVNLFLP